jgi:N-acetylneuraminate synthase
MIRKVVKIGDTFVGDEHPCYVVAEIGINHNGSIDNTFALIDIAVQHNCNAVKFQKRTIDIVYSQDELTRPRDSPFGSTNGDLKEGLEFGYEEFLEIDKYCKEKGIGWFASCWDESSVDFIERFDPPCYKIASASLTDDDLLRYHNKLKKPLIISTGMSTMEEINHAVQTIGTDNLIILHSTSTYPANPEELNLSVIQVLREIYDVPIGYSGHEVGVATSCAAIYFGACMVERHITLDRALWGSDQAASLEPDGLRRLVEYIRVLEIARGDGIKKVYPSEIPIIKKLRRK